MNDNDSSVQELNLTPYRQPTSVWDRSGWDGTRERLAVTRLLVGIAGGALAIQALRRRTWAGGTLAALGSTLAWWALTGEGDLTGARRWFAQVLERSPWQRQDPVHDASKDSFPASDPPSLTPAVGTGLRKHVPPASTARRAEGKAPGEKAPRGKKIMGSGIE